MSTRRGSKSRLHSHSHKDFGDPKRMCMVIEQRESPNETQGQSEKHSCGPGDDNEEKGNIVETKEGASSGSLSFLTEWHGKSASPTKEWRLPQGLAKPRGGQTYCKPEVGAVRRDMNGGMPEE